MPSVANIILVGQAWLEPRKSSRLHQPSTHARTAPRSARFYRLSAKSSKEHEHLLCDAAMGSLDFVGNCRRSATQNAHFK